MLILEASWFLVTMELFIELMLLVYTGLLCCVYLVVGISLAIKAIMTYVR